MGDSGTPPPPSPLHDASPPSTPPQTPLVAPQAGAETEGPTLPVQAPDAAPPPPPPLDGRKTGGGGTAAAGRNHNLDKLRRCYRYHHNLDDLPPGYRFHPQDDELVTHYLENKINGHPLPQNKIHDVKLYDHNPEYLAAEYPQWGENKWFFFTPRERKYPNGDRPNRAAGDGYWKATGSDKPVIRRTGDQVGVKKALVFYRGKPPNGDKTNWIMLEYRIEDPNHGHRHDGTMKLDDWVLCSIHESTEGKERRWRRDHVEAKPYRTSSSSRRGRRPQPSGTVKDSRGQAATACPRLHGATSSDGGLVLPSPNYVDPSEGNSRDAHVGHSPYLHASMPSAYFDPSGYHEPFMENDPLYGKYDKLNTIGSLLESQVSGSEIIPWTPNYGWMPRLSPTNDYIYTSCDDACFSMQCSSRKHQLLENALDFDCLDSLRDLISDGDAIDAPTNPSDYDSSNPFGYDNMIPTINAMDSTIPKIYAKDVTPISAIHEAGTKPEDATPTSPTANTCSAVSETTYAALHASANCGILPSVDGLDWESSFIDDKNQLHQVMHSWTGHFNKL